MVYGSCFSLRDVEAPSDLVVYLPQVPGGCGRTRDAHTAQSTDGHFPFAQFLIGTFEIVL
jgi:hypothetical protein